MAAALLFQTIGTGPQSSFDNYTSAGMLQSVMPRNESRGMAISVCRAWIGNEHGGRCCSYLSIHTLKHEHQQCCAIDYILHTVDSATALLNSPRAFPSRCALLLYHFAIAEPCISITIPQASQRHFASLARRLGRIFAHAYFQHREAFEQTEAESSLYSRYLALTSTYDLVPADYLNIPARDSATSLHHLPVIDSAHEVDRRDSPVRETGRGRTDTMVLTEGFVLPTTEQIEAYSSEQDAHAAQFIAEKERDEVHDYVDIISRQTPAERLGLGHALVRQPSREDRAMRNAGFDACPGEPQVSFDAASASSDESSGEYSGSPPSTDARETGETGERSLQPDYEQHTAPTLELPDDSFRLNDDHRELNDLGQSISTLDNIEGKEETRQDNRQIELDVPDARSDSQNHQEQLADASSFVDEDYSDVSNDQGGDSS
jgi:hypothetical protein